MSQITMGDINQCLQFFEGKDAFTGEDLDFTNDENENCKTGFAYIIPTFIDESLNIKNNFIPCSFKTLSQMPEDYALPWFQKMHFFDPDRLLKIYEWMSKSEHFEYSKKYKYVSKSQLRYIDLCDENKTFRRFNVVCPNKQKITLYHPYLVKNLKSDFTRKQMSDQIYNVVIKDFEAYLNEHWIDEKQGMLNTSRFLDRCADFILNGELDYEGNMKYYKYETPASNLSKSMMDILEYGDADSSFVENIKYLMNDHTDYSEEICGQYKSDKRRKKIDSIFCKINRLFTREAFSKLEYVNLKNKEVYDNCKPEDAEKYAKNIHNQAVVDMRIIDYPKREGIINTNIPYLISWQYVWSNGEFEFDNELFQIDIGHHMQYVDISKTKRKGNNTYWSMDKVLCVKQSGIYHFFDMNIKKLTHIYKGDSRV